MTKLPIPPGIRWLRYQGKTLTLDRDWLPGQIKLHFPGRDRLVPWKDLDKETQRFFSSVVEVEWSRGVEKSDDYVVWFNSLKNARKWREAGGI
jgi:hypothetical protein